MKTRIRIGLILAGYVAAVLIAFGALAIRLASTRGSAQASGGMYAFGDSLLFLAVFGVAALAPTTGALYFLRSHRLFWTVLAVLALVIAVTGLAAIVLYVV